MGDTNFDSLVTTGTTTSAGFISTTLLIDRQPSAPPQ